MASVTIELRIGPTLLLALRTLDVVRASLELIPEWNINERCELESEARNLCKLIETHQSTSKGEA